MLMCSRSVVRGLARLFFFVGVTWLGVLLPTSLPWSLERGKPNLQSPVSSLAMANSFKPPGEDPLSLPVVVVGGGLAGLSAAAEIVANGGSVVIVEKTDRLGGNSAKASSGMNAAGSGPQEAAGIEDTPELLVNDTLKSGKGRSTPMLAELVAHQSADAVRFLQGFGINLDSIQQLGGHSRPRTHRAAPDGKPMNIGYRIMSALISHIQEEEKKDPAKVRILVKSTVTQLNTQGIEEGISRVVGVRVARVLENGDSVIEDVRGNSVILATGGYSADREGLLKEHAPCLHLLPTTNGPFATGDGVRLGSVVGAALVDMDQVQVHPTGLVDPKEPLSPVKILGPEILRGSGGILLNQQGKRFVNELSTRDQVVDAMLRNCDPLSTSDPPNHCKGAEGECCPVPSVGAHLLLSQEALEKFGEDTAKFYMFKGLLRKFSSLSELCLGLNLSLGQVLSTLKEYNRAAAGDATDPFGKTLFPCTYSAYVEQGNSPPIYAAVVTPVLHYCMGGLAFDPLGHVLRHTTEEPPRTRIIPGLLAAGEVTGGLHGANRLAGNSLLECVVYGRIAAKTALAEAAAQRDVLSAGEMADLVHARLAAKPGDAGLPVKDEL